jgi:hypothetical protein
VSTAPHAGGREPSISDLIVTAMTLRNLKQGEVAKLCGISDAQFSSAKSGRYRLGAAALAKLKALATIPVASPALPPTVSVALQDIRVDDGINQRAGGIDDALVSEYAASIKDWIEQAPVTLMREGAVHRLVDGFHRVAAARQAGLTEIPAVVLDGGYRTALLYATGCNRTHGARRTRADVQHAIRTMLADKEWGAQSDRWIAEHVGISPTTVGAVRAQLPNPDTCREATPGERPDTDQVSKLDTCPPPSPAPAQSKYLEILTKAPTAAPEEESNTKPEAKFEAPETYPPTEPTATRIGASEPETGQTEPTVSPAPKRVGRDGKAYPATKPKPAPRPVDALRLVQTVIGALAELGDIADVLAPEDRVRLVAELRGALELHEGGSHA